MRPLAKIDRIDRVTDEMGQAGGPGKVWIYGPV